MARPSIHAGSIGTAALMRATMGRTRYNGFSERAHRPDRTKCQSRNHVTLSLYRTDQSRGKACCQICLPGSCNVAAAHHMQGNQSLP